MSCIIFHLAEPADAQALEKSNVYRAPSLNTEGFIHCATAEQLPGVIQRYYRSATSLVLLTINSASLGENLVMENTLGGEEHFPHVYAAIESSAIVATKQLDTTAIQSIALMDSYTAS